jgi:hypothetical protein
VFKESLVWMGGRVQRKGFKKRLRSENCGFEEKI